jgi:hypothetical protein
MTLDLAGHLERMQRDGFTIVENAIEPELVAALRADLERLARELAVTPAANIFEGTKTLRIYNLLARGAIYQQVPVHERAEEEPRPCDGASVAERVVAERGRGVAERGPREQRPDHHRE